MPDNDRKLRFETTADLVRELDELEAAQRSRGVVSTGAWSPGQNLQHVARFYKAALDGFGFTLPAPVRFLFRLVLKPIALKRTIRGGLKIPAKARPALQPDEGASFEQGLADLRAQLGRINARERMQQPSPVLGPLSHEEWTELQLRHAELHLGKLRPAGEEAPQG
ncbi:MAG: DUF1569 domain-containing protein [Phycisphaerales bacterium]|nr:DUF1569 domain-containing protein [Phycisphaerales bacterium]